MSTQRHLRSDTTKKVGRPTLLHQALTKEEQSARKKCKREEEKRKQKTSEARSAAALKRWHGKPTSTNTLMHVDGGSGDNCAANSCDGDDSRGSCVGYGGGSSGDGRGDAEESSCYDAETVGGVIDLGGEDSFGDRALDEIVIEASAENVSADESHSKQTGESQRSRYRAKANFDSHMDKYNDWQKIDILRQLCIRLRADGRKVEGVEIERKYQRASALTKSQIRYAAELILEDAREKKSFRFWLPSLVSKNLIDLEKLLRR